MYTLRYSKRIHLYVFPFLYPYHVFSCFFITCNYFEVYRYLLLVVNKLKLKLNPSCFTDVLINKRKQ